jgi:hypothetical protein
MASAGLLPATGMQKDWRGSARRRLVARICSGVGVSCCCFISAVIFVPTECIAAGVVLDRVEVAIFQQYLQKHGLIARENGDLLEKDPLQSCRQRRVFELMKLSNVTGPGGMAIFRTYGRIDLMVCRAGPLGVEELPFTIDKSLKLLGYDNPKATSLMKGVEGFGLEIDGRPGRAFVLMSLGHGVGMAPIAVVRSRDGDSNLIVAISGAHLWDGVSSDAIPEVLREVSALLSAVDKAV